MPPQFPQTLKSTPDLIQKNKTQEQKITISDLVNTIITNKDKIFNNYKYTSFASIDNFLKEHFKKKFTPESIIKTIDKLVEMQQIEKAFNKPKNDTENEYTVFAEHSEYFKGYRWIGK